MMKFLLIVLVLAIPYARAIPSCTQMLQAFNGEWCVELRGPTLPSEWSKATLVETEMGFTGILRSEDDGSFTHLSPCMYAKQCHLAVRVSARPYDVARSSTGGDIPEETDAVILPDSYLRGRGLAAPPIRAYQDGDDSLTVIQLQQQQSRIKARRIRINRRRRNANTKYPTARPTQKPTSGSPTIAPTMDPTSILDVKCAEKGVLSPDGRVCLSRVNARPMPTPYVRCAPNPTPSSLPCSLVTRQTVSIMYTPQLLRGWGDVDGLIKLALAETNQIYMNSRIPITLDLVYSGVTPFDETGDSYTDLVTFRGLGQTPVPSNMAVILVLNSGSCGRAYLDCGKYVESAFCARAIVKASCATGYYSFAHELGHLQGADHQALYDSPYAGRRFADNLGYVSPKFAFRTVMAYAEYDEPRVAVFSSPDIMYRGAVAGIRGSANNARVIQATREEIAVLY